MTTVQLSTLRQAAVLAEQILDLVRKELDLLTLDATLTTTNIDAVIASQVASLKSLIASI